MRHKYPTAQEWLLSRCRQEVRNNNPQGVLELVQDIIIHADGDEIQDLFQSEMSDNGYFYDFDSDLMSDADAHSMNWDIGDCMYFMQNRMLTRFDEVTDLTLHKPAPSWKVTYSPLVKDLATFFGQQLEEVIYADRLEDIQQLVNQMIQLYDDAEEELEIDDGSLSDAHRMTLEQACKAFNPK